MNAYIELLRIDEWYKNITVFLGILFALFVYRINLNLDVFYTILGITLLSCSVSSANYILNAITDKNLDRKHPLKKLRPLPSKKITEKKAFSFLIILLALVFCFSFLIFNFKVTLSLLSLFIAAVFYNIRPIRLKDIPYIDVLSESVNNPIRFMIGWFAFTYYLPNIWILFLVWFLACFLMTKKRLEELNNFKQKAKAYRNVFRYYSKTSLKNAMITYLILSFASIFIFFLRGIL